MTEVVTDSPEGSDTGACGSGVPGHQAGGPGRAKANQELEMGFSISVRNRIGILVALTLSPWIALGGTVIFVIISLPIRAHDLSFHSF